jgi:hypothetical protein
MQRARCRIAKQTGAYAYFAEVEVVRGAPMQDPPVAVDDDFKGLTPFTRAALLGVGAALKAAGSRTPVLVREVTGTYSDTTGATVALAAAEATWKLIGHDLLADGVRAVGGLEDSVLLAQGEEALTMVVEAIAVAGRVAG